jgi:hypothetical protein
MNVEVEAYITQYIVIRWPSVGVAARKILVKVRRSPIAAVVS